MIAIFCHVLIRIARALEWVRLEWGTIVLEGRLERWTVTRPEGRHYFLFTRVGRILMAPVGWMNPVAVWLTRLANRGLPPLPPDTGFLARLYPR